MVAADVLTAVPVGEREDRAVADGAVEEIDLRAWLRSDELASRCFRNYLVFAWVLLVARYGQRRWFFADDWFMLAGRDGGDIGSIVQSHNEHLMATVVVAYRVLFNVFGLQYTPFLIAVVTTHVALVWLLRALLRYVGVSAWTSVAVAGSLVLFGAGEENILWSIQISWNCALIFGLLQLLAADGSGPLRRRDVLGVAFGFVALVSASSIGLTLVAVTGIVAVARRQFVRAFVQTAPILAAYVGWVLAVDPDSPGDPGRPSFATGLHWTSEGLVGPVRAIAQNLVVATALGVVLVAGLIVSNRTTGPIWWRRNAIVLSMLVTSPLLFLVIGWQRWRYGIEMAGAPRYLYVGAVLVLPAFAVAIDALTRAARPVGIAAGVLLLTGIPANVALLDDPGFGASTYDHERQLVLGLAHDPLIDQVPEWVQLSTGPFENPGFNVGWLRTVRDRGWLPDPGDIDQRAAYEFPLRLGLVEQPGEIHPLTDHCAERTRSLDLDLALGDQVWVDGIVFAQTLEDGDPVSSLVAFVPVRDRSMKLTVIVPNISVRFVIAEPGARLRACEAR